VLVMVFVLVSVLVLGVALVPWSTLHAATSCHTSVWPVNKDVFVLGLFVSQFA
jgi:hypothetical protein